MRRARAAAGVAALLAVAVAAEAAVATRGSGLSIAVDDMLIPTQKGEIIADAEKEVQEIEKHYTSGLVTQGERYNKVVDIWGRAGDLVAKAMMEQLGVEPVMARVADDALIVDLRTVAPEEDEILLSALAGLAG